jgi:deoxyribonucleoside regulator
MADRHPQLVRAHLAARLYYLDGLPQVEVARLLEVSQTKVSRLLQLARERGIVRIAVDEYQPRQPELEQQLRTTLQVNEAVVIRSHSEESVASTRRNVGYFAAPAAAEMIRPAQVIGLTGGRTLAELVRRIHATRPMRDLRIVQLMGSIGAAVDDADAIELSRRLASVFGGTYYALNMPAFASSCASRKTFLEQEQARTIWQLYQQMTLALVGIGTLEESAFIDRGVLSDDDLRRLRKAGAVGEICGRFFDRRGQECKTDYRQRVVSIELDQLRRVPQVIGVTTGAARAEAVALAVHTGLIKSLVVDERCARAMLARAAPPAAKARRSRTVAGSRT